MLMNPRIHEPEIPDERNGLRLLLSIKSDPLHYFTNLMNREGAYAWLRVDGRPLLMLNDATGIEHVLQRKCDNYRKGHFHKVLKPLFGDSMFLSEGHAWKHRREDVAPVFAHGNFDEMVRQMTFAAEAMFERWNPRIARGEIIDVTIEMTRFALDALLRALFHESRDDFATEMRSALGIILRDAENRMWSSLSLPEIIAYNLPKYRASRKFLKSIVSELIEARRTNKAYPEDLLSRLVEDFGSSPQEQKVLFDEVLSFVLAGHDTTAHGLAWALHNISLYPSVQQKVEEEVASVLSNKTPDMESIKKLTYTRQVFDEVLRLYPPVWTMSREAIADDKIPLDDGTHVNVPAGAAVMMCHYAVHRRETYWKNPEAFDPERFNPEAVEARQKFAWFPFGGGARMCLGFRFAQVESVLALAMITQRYQFSLVSGQHVRPEPIITLRPADSIHFRMQKRTDFFPEATILAANNVPAKTHEQVSKCPFHQDARQTS